MQALPRLVQLRILRGAKTLSQNFADRHSLPVSRIWNDVTNRMANKTRQRWYCGRPNLQLAADGLVCHGGCRTPAAPAGARR